MCQSMECGKEDTSKGVSIWSSGAELSIGPSTVSKLLTVWFEFMLDLCVKIPARKHKRTQTPTNKYLFSEPTYSDVNIIIRRYSITLNIINYLLPTKLFIYCLYPSACLSVHCFVLLPKCTEFCILNIFELRFHITLCSSHASKLIWNGFRSTIQLVFGMCIYCWNCFLLKIPRDCVQFGSFVETFYQQFTNCHMLVILLYCFHHMLLHAVKCKATQSATLPTSGSG